MDLRPAGHSHEGFLHILCRSVRMGIDELHMRRRLQVLSLDRQLRVFGKAPTEAQVGPRVRRHEKTRKFVEQQDSPGRERAAMRPHRVGFGCLHRLPRKATCTINTEHERVVSGELICIQWLIRWASIGTFSEWRGLCACSEATRSCPLLSQNGKPAPGGSALHWPPRRRGCPRFRRVATMLLHEPWLNRTRFGSRARDNEIPLRTIFLLANLARRTAPAAIRVRVIAQGTAKRTAGTRPGPVNRK